MNYLKTTKDLCCGCMACVQVCPNKCIDALKDENGLLYSKLVRPGNCIDCQMCAHVCPMLKASSGSLKFLRAKNAVSAVNKNVEIVKGSSSGGAFSAIAKAVAKDGECYIFGAAFSDGFNVRHICVDGIEKIGPLMKSKYVQSDTGKSFADVRNFLKEGRRVLFSGTPCQIAALKLFLRRDYDKLLLVDFSCHGVAMPAVFKRYLDEMGKKYGSRVLQYSFREKMRRFFSYSCVSSKFTFENGKTLMIFKDPFFQGFVRAFYKMEACHSCPYARAERVSDITMADFWGIENVNPNQEAGKGVSLILANTDKGREYLKKISADMDLHEYPFECCLAGNGPLNGPLKRDGAKARFFEAARTMTVADAVNSLIKRPHSLKSLVLKIMEYLPMRMRIFAFKVAGKQCR